MKRALAIAAEVVIALGLTLAIVPPLSPAMAAGLTDELLSMEDIARMIEAHFPPKKRGPYKKAA